MFMVLANNVFYSKVFYVLFALFVENQYEALTCKKVIKKSFNVYKSNLFSSCLLINYQDI